MCNIFWCFTVQADHIITIDKKHHESQIIDFAIPYDIRVDNKDVEKIEKYLDLSIRLKKVSNMKVTLVLFVVGTLGTPAKALDKRLKTISIETKITELQKLYIPAESSEKLLSC